MFINPKRAAYLSGAGFLALAAVFFLADGWRRNEDRVYRIGWEDHPPFQQPDEDGQPTGVAVELVREAARRKGVKLQWSRQERSSEYSLRNAKVDLWPLMTITEERKQLVHISDPYLQHDQGFLVRGETDYWRKQDLTNARIAHLNIPILSVLVHQVLPNATLITKATLDDAIQEICVGGADAVLTDEFTSVSLLFRGRTCGGQPLRLVWIPELPTKMGVGSTFEASAAADRIREGIGDLANEGRLAEIVSRWGYFSPRNQETMNALLHSRRRESLLIAALLLLATLFGVTIFALDRLRSQKARIDALQAAATLRESEDRFRNLADTAPVMIWVVGADRMATFFNKQWLEFTGRSSEQELGMGWVNDVHPDDREQCLSAFDAAFSVRGRYQQEHRLCRADGESRWLLCTGIPRFTESGFAGYVGCSIDVTDHRQQQEQLLASQKLESLGVLAGGIAHDFNNMLAAIMATSESALDDLPEGSPAQEELSSIRAVAIRAAEIVREMMAYSGQEKTQFEPVDVSQLVAEMLHLLKISIAKQATLKIDLEENLPPILANPAQIRQVVMNLITNGSEAIGENPGVLAIATTRVPAACNGDCGAETAGGDQIRLVVSDTGVGMAEEVRARIFDPFFTTKFTGRGLGLAAVQGIIRKHGGTIHVLSTPGQGSRFEIRLPCTDQARDAASTSNGFALQAEKTATVLVVEDEDVLRSAVSKLLRKKGFSIIEASDGIAAGELFREHGERIDAILLDLTLPGLPGSKVLEEVRRIRPQVKVVVTTAYGRDTVLASVPGMEWGYLQKPYRMGDLLHILCNLMPDSVG